VLSLYFAAPERMMLTRVGTYIVSLIIVFTRNCGININEHCLCHTHVRIPHGGRIIIIIIIIMWYYTWNILAYILLLQRECIPRHGRVPKPRQKPYRSLSKMRIICTWDGRDDELILFSDDKRCTMVTGEKYNIIYSLQKSL